MPCRVSSDVHEWSNEGPTVPARSPVNPRNVDEQSTNSQREKKSLGALLQPVVESRLLMHSVSGSHYQLPLSGGSEATMKHHSSTTSILTQGNLRTSIGGQFGWGGPPLKRYRGGPKVGSGGSEIHRRGQGQKPA